MRNGAARWQHDMALFAVLAILGAIWPIPAHANHGVFYKFAWSNQLYLSMSVDPDMPSNAYVSRSANGVVEWNTAFEDQEPRIYYIGSRMNIPAYDQTCASPVAIGFTRQQLNSVPGLGVGTVGATDLCIDQNSPTRIIRASVFYDNGAGNFSSYYLGTGDPRDNSVSDEYDLWSLASHELGHAMGWVPHWDEQVDGDVNVVCPGDNSRRTMCKGPIGERIMERTLGGKEIAQHRGEYPHP